MTEESSFVSFVCASCGQELEAPRDMIGQAVECPSCGARLVVTPPDATGTATQAQKDAMKSRTIRIELGDL